MKQWHLNCIHKCYQISSEIFDEVRNTLELWLKRLFFIFQFMPSNWLLYNLLASSSARGYLKTYYLDPRMWSIEVPQNRNDSIVLTHFKLLISLPKFVTYQNFPPQYFCQNSLELSPKSKVSVNLVQLIQTTAKQAEWNKACCLS